MRIVVAGASGNLGTALLRRLRGTDHEVVGIARRPPELLPPYDVATWHALDLTAEGAGEALVPLLSGADAVVNLVWGFQPSRDIDYLERVGVGGVRALLAAAPAAGVRQLVQLSSVGAYSPGAHGIRVTESWPTSGTVDFSYSRHKAAAERLLDAAEADLAGQLIVTRVRPGIVVQRAAGSELMRYGAPAWLSGTLLRYAVVLPLDRAFVVPIVHSDDVADALVRMVEQRAAGAFNLATEPPLTREIVAEVLGARQVHVPAGVLERVAALTWRARVQPLDPGWVALGFAVPLLDTTRARDDLGWAPRISTREALADVLGGITSREGTVSPVMRVRAVPGELARAVRDGLPGNRRML